MKSRRVVLALIVCSVAWAEHEKKGGVAAQQAASPLLAKDGATPETLSMSGLSFDPRKTSSRLSKAQLDRSVKHLTFPW
jgi:hypothetical protein